MSALEEATAAGLIVEPVQDLAAVPARLRGRRQTAILTLGRVIVVLLPIVTLLLADGAELGRLDDDVLVPAIWFLALWKTFDAAWLSPLALGLPTTCTLGTLTGLAGVSLAEFWLPGPSFDPRELLTIALGVLVASGVFETLAAWKLQRRRRVIIVGGSQGGLELASELARRSDLPFRFLGLVRDEEDGDLPNGLALGDWRDLPEIIRTRRPDVVVLARPGAHSAVVSKLVTSAAVGFRLVGIPDFYEHTFGRVPIEHLSPTWFMSVLHLYQHTYSRAAKRLLDIVLALAGLIAVAPLVPVIAWLVHRSGPGPVIFRQRRLGEGGNTFEMVKFRTMSEGAEEPGHPRWAEENDPRVTPFGRFLRRSRLDELPQLWNVLRGEMSIVGPRPERSEFLELIEAEVPYWSQRLLIKPGITGWAQVRRGYAADIEGAAEKLSYDLYYLKHRSLVLDLAITFKTARILVSGNGVR